MSNRLSEIRKQAATHAGKWEVRDNEIYDPEGIRLARCQSSGLAAYIAGIHSTWLTLSNAWLLARRALRDRNVMTAVQRKDSK